MSEGFLSRWARRKEAVKAAEQTPLPSPLRGGDGGGGGADGTAALDLAPPPPPASSPQGGGEARAPDSLALDDRTAASEATAETEQPLLDLPSLDALTPETDLTPFLRAGVPSALRNAALRRMWSLDPAIRDFVSEAREYAYDWNTPGGVPGLGPLLPGDDVKAMLGRLFRDPAAEPEAEAAAAADAAPEEALEQAPAESPEADIKRAGGDAPTLEGAAVQSKVAEGNSVEPMVAPAPRPEPRLRRHGGARPG